MRVHAVGTAGLRQVQVPTVGCINCGTARNSYIRYCGSSGLLRKLHVLS